MKARLIYRLEEVDITRLHAQSKVVGTLVNIGGATLLTFAHRRAIFVAVNLHPVHTSKII
jgi:hypothetical protein